MTGLVTIRVHNGVADVRLNRPGKLNALHEGMFSALVDAGETLKADPTVRAVVLSGEGRAFCAGLDLESFRDIANGHRKPGAAPIGRLRSEGESDEGGFKLHQRAALIFSEIPVPVIAAIHGVAFGGGLQLTLGCDMRFIAADARLSAMEINWGLVPDMAAMLFLPRLIRDDVAREMIFTGREIDGEEALRLGLASRVCVDPLSEALAMAAEIATKSPQAVRAAKRLLNASRVVDRSAILRMEADEQALLIGSPDQVKAVADKLGIHRPIGSGQRLEKK